MEAEIDETRQNYITSRCEKYSEDNGCLVSSSGTSEHNDLNTEPEGQWVSEFTPRSKTEVTRNCVTVKKETKDHVIKTVFEQLLHCDNCEMKVGHDGRSWKKGGKLPIGEVAALFDREMLQELKSECGGLQTLLRNSSHVYQGKLIANLL